MGSFGVVDGRRTYSHRSLKTLVHKKFPNEAIKRPWPGSKPSQVYYSAPSELVISVSSFLSDENSFFKWFTWTSRFALLSVSVITSWFWNWRFLLISLRQKSYWQESWPLSLSSLTLTPIALAHSIPYLLANFLELSFFRYSYINPPNKNNIEE